MKYERRFQGPANAGLRKQIRDLTNGLMPACGPVLERGVLSLLRTVALTPSGVATLREVAADYRATAKDWNPRCDCDACYSGNLQRLGALG